MIGTKHLWNKALSVSSLQYGLGEDREREREEARSFIDCFISQGCTVCWWGRCLPQEEKQGIVCHGNISSSDGWILKFNLQNFILKGFSIVLTTSAPCYWLSPPVCSHSYCHSKYCQMYCRSSTQCIQQWLSCCWRWPVAGCCLLARSKKNTGGHKEAIRMHSHIVGVEQTFECSIYFQRSI